MKIERHFSRKPIDDEKLKRLWPTKLTDCEIAEKLGHGKWVIRRRARKLGLRLRRIIWREAAE